MAAGMYVKEGDVVWVNIENGFPKWPCKIMSITVEDSVDVLSFGDDIRYTKKMNKILPFRTNLPLIAKGKKSLRSKNHWFKLFEEAITSAIEYIQSYIDPNFTLSDAGPSYSVKKSGQQYFINNDTITPVPSTTESTIAPVPSTTESTIAPVPSTTESTIVPPLSFTTTTTAPLLSTTESTIAPPLSTTTTTVPVLSTTESTIAPILYTAIAHAPNTTAISSSFTEPIYTSTPSVKRKNHSNDGSPDHNGRSKRLRYDETSVIDHRSTSSLSKNSPSPLKCSDEESDDDLPSVSFTDDTWNAANNAQPKDVIWAKYLRYPHWPALVDVINTKKKFIKVFFLGWMDRHSVKMKLHNKTNFAAYEYENIEKYKKMGMEMLSGTGKSSELSCFEHALNEAEMLPTLRLNKGNDVTPKELYEEVVQLRPSTFEGSLIKSPLKSTNFDKDALPFGTSSNDDSQRRQEEEEEENEDADDSNSDNHDDSNSPYSFTNLEREFHKLEPELLGICRGSIPSSLHHQYMSSDKKERSFLKDSEKFGPAHNLTDHKKSILIGLLNDVTGQVFEGRDFSYAYDVLLPEAMSRVISRAENIPLKEALEKLQSI